MRERSEHSRLVGYQVYGGVSSYTGEYDSSLRFASWVDSDDIQDDIKDSRLRCALRLADAAQRLGVVSDPVSVVVARPHACIASSFESYDQVDDNLPPNIFDMLKRPFERGDAE